LAAGSKTASSRGAAPAEEEDEGPPKTAAVVKDVMTADDVAVYLSVSRSTIYKMVQAGEMPYTKMGSMLRFPKLVLDRWLADHTTQPERTLLDEFEILYEKFHLKKFLRAKGINYQELTDEQLLEHVMIAIRDLRSYEEAEKNRPQE
jgi:excisionase family DNA binding protein